MKKPSSRLAYTIGDSIKPKARENITADMKLRCFSLTVLDSLCGMVWSCTVFNNGSQNLHDWSELLKRLTSSLEATYESGKYQFRIRYQLKLNVGILQRR